MEEFQYFRVLFTSEGRMEQEINQCIGTASTVMQALHPSVVMKKDLSQKILFIGQSLFLPSPVVTNCNDHMGNDMKE